MHYFCCGNVSDTFSWGRGNAELKLVLAYCSSLLWWGFNRFATSDARMAYFWLGGRVGTH